MSIGSLLPWLLAVAAAAAAVYAFKSLGALKSASTDVAERLAQEGNRHAEEKARLEFELSEWREKAVRFEKRVAEVEESLAEATGEPPTIFAYPNGQDGDFTSHTTRLLHDAGFEAAMTMAPGFINRADDIYALPRYGAPESVDEAEATVSGTYETLKEWRTSISMNRNLPR